jgi:hypothetical protein
MCIEHSENSVICPWQKLNFLLTFRKVSDLSIKQFGCSSNT